MIFGVCWSFLCALVSLVLVSLCECPMSTKNLFSLFLGFKYLYLLFNVIDYVLQTFYIFSCFKLLVSGRNGLKSPLQSSP